MLSWIQYVIVGIIVSSIAIGVPYAVITLHNRQVEIDTLKSAVDTANFHTREAAQLANDNAAAILFLKNKMIKDQEIVAKKDEINSRLSIDIANLQNRVSNEKDTNCIAMSITAMVIGLRHLQTRSDPGKQGNASGIKSTKRASQSTATSPSTVDRSVARWVGQLYEHDRKCTANLAAIAQQQGE